MTSGAHKQDPSSSGSSPNDPPPPTEQHIERKKEKRRRNPLSCAECRRLKLRCDRVFPCESCRKRGCAAICPDGALTTKGTRFVLANTEELHVKIFDMSERIRQLEDALAASHHSSEPHPLLAEDLLLVKVPVEFKNEGSDSKSLERASQSEGRPEVGENFVTAFGTLKIGTDGYSRFFGQTARTEHFMQDDEEAALELSKIKHPLPPDILQLCHVFPFGSPAQDTNLINRILSFLPPANEAWPLIENYYSHGCFMYVPCQRQYFTENVFNQVYENINDPERLSKHRLALVFAILAHGALTDINREPYSSLAEQMQLLSRASLAMTPLLAEPSIHAIQALHLLALYSALSDKPDGGPVGWLIQGLNIKLAQALGLHRDLEFWGADEKDKDQVEVRRWVFWEIITLDAWLSLGLGRPPTLHFSQVDCKLPEETRRAAEVSDNSLHVWRTWKHPFTTFVHRVLQKALDAKTPPYSEILELDRSLHKCAMPPDVESISRGLPVAPPPPEKTPLLTMERALLLSAKFIAVLLLHRGFFAQALGERNDPMQSKYAPSVLATYRSACLVVMSLYHAYDHHPELTCRFGLFWSNAFSASISLCLLVTRATKSSYAPLALEHLDLAYDLMRKAAPDCYPASKALPMATKLYDKAHAAFAPYGDGQHPTSLALRRPADDDDEELNVLGGRTNVMADKPSNDAPSATLQVPSPQPIYPDSPGTPLQLPPTSHLDSVHPSLVEYVAESSHWVSDMRGEAESNHTYVQHSMPLATSQQSSLQPAQHAISYSQEQLYSDVGISSQQDYHAYPAYPSTSESSISPTTPAAGGSFPHNPQYTYYDQSYHAQGQGLAGPGQPEVYHPQPQNQYTTWQNYVQQLYK